MLLQIVPNFFITTERGDSYGYEYSGEDPETYDRSQLVSYEEAFSVGQEALRSGQAVSMHARDRRYPRSYDSEGYVPDSTDSTEVGMNVYEVRKVVSIANTLIVEFILPS